MCPPSQDSMQSSQWVRVAYWWPRFWSSLAFELVNNASVLSGMPSEPHRPTPLQVFHNDMLMQRPRPFGYVPLQKQRLRSV